LMVVAFNTLMLERVAPEALMGTPTPPALVKDAKSTVETLLKLLPDTLMVAPVAVSVSVVTVVAVADVALMVVAFNTFTLERVAPEASMGVPAALLKEARSMLATLLRLFPDTLMAPDAAVVVSASMVTDVAFTAFTLDRVAPEALMGVPATLLKEARSTLATLLKLLPDTFMAVPVVVSASTVAVVAVANVALMVVAFNTSTLERVVPEALMGPATLLNDAN